MARDQAALQSWYRQAMLRRIDALRALVEPLEAGNAEACDSAREIGQALRSSGATFGFAELTAVATIVEQSSDVNILRRVEGLITQLHALTASDDASPGFRAEWLARAAGVPYTDPAVEGAHDLAEAWIAVSQVAGIDASTLAARVAEHLGLEVASLGQRGHSALRLVPGALMAAGRLIPLSEDSVTITVALAEPTSLPLELEVERLTGRRPVFVVAPPAALDAVLSEVLDMPASPAAVSAAPLVPSTMEKEDVGERDILVVDDDPSTRLLLRSLLEKRGHRVFEAEDGLQALEVMKRNEAIGLVIADLNMPRMDGLELMWELRDAQEVGYVAVIVVTGEVDEVLETQLMEEGADDYIRKPVDPRLFLARVEATIRRMERR